MIALTPIVFAGATIAFIASPAVIFGQHIAFIILWAVLVITIPLWVFAHIHQFFWGEANPKFPKWLPSLKSWGESIFAAVITITLMLLMLLYIYIILEGSGGATDYRWKAFFREHGDVLAPVFIILCAYCYHFKYLIAKRFDPNRFRPTKKP